MDKAFLARSAVERLQAVSRETLYLHGGLDRTRPVVVQGMVTERCNYRCEYCAFGRRESTADEISSEEWCAALVTLREFIGPFLIQFAGGEPFVKRGFLDILDFCHEQGIHFGLITNGSGLSERNCRRLSNARPFNVDVSVDASRAEIHDAVRGVPGSLESIEAGVGRLLEARRTVGADFPIRIKTTVHRRNQGTLSDLVRWVEAIGATSVDFSPVRRWTPEVEEDLWIRDSKSLQSLEREIAELIRLKRAGAPIETSEEKLSAFVDHFEDREGSLAVSPCRVGMREYHIRPNGDVKVCWYHPAIGNVRRGDARSIWHGEKARAVRLNTVQCELFKVHSCAHSCLGHQPIRKLVARTWMLMRHSGRGAARDARKEG